MLSQVSSSSGAMSSAAADGVEDAKVSGKIRKREMGFMAHRAHYWNRTGSDGPTSLSSLKAHRSSIEPPPLPIIMTSGTPQIVSLPNAATISSGALLPCTEVGLTSMLIPGDRL